MPYTVTTKQAGGCIHCGATSNLRWAGSFGGVAEYVCATDVCAQRGRAVATLEEAQRIVNREIGNRGLYYGPLRDRDDQQPETIGPMPDGTVIEVERQPDDFDVDAYNVAQEKEAR